MKELLGYIEYLKTANAKSIYTNSERKEFSMPDGRIGLQPSYPIYSADFNSFITTACKYFDVQNYQEVINKAYPNLINPASHSKSTQLKMILARLISKRFRNTEKDRLRQYKLAISNADLTVLSAMFTKELRMERFCDGHWIVCHRHGIFLALVNRLSQLI